MPPDELAAQLNAMRARAQELVSGLTPEELTRRPDPSRWSITECLTHLNLTAAVVQPKIADAIEKGRAAHITGKPPFSPGAFGRLLIWIAEPPPKFKIRAPRGISPTIAHGDPSKAAAEFMEFQGGWEKLIRDCAGLNQEKIKVPALFRGIPRLRLSATIPWMMAHQRRHLIQAEEVKQEILKTSSLAKA